MAFKLFATTRNKYLWFFGACLCGLLCSAAAVADDVPAVKSAADEVSTVKINPDICAEFKIRALIMEVNRARSYMIVGEKTCHVRNYQIGEEILTPRLADSNNNAIELKDFKEGNRVFVRGYELDDGRIFASEVVLINSKTTVR